MLDALRTELATLRDVARFDPTSLTFAAWVLSYLTEFRTLPSPLYVGARLSSDERQGESGAPDAHAYWARVASWTAEGTTAHRAALAAFRLTEIAQ